MRYVKEQQRKRRQDKIRSKVQSSAKRPRLMIFRSLTNIYAQIVDDKGSIIASSSSIKIKKGKGVEKAKQVGVDLAKKAAEKKIKTCVFDRAGYFYHGRVKALAEGAREGGLNF